MRAAETAWQRARGVYERCVARFIAPSVFMREVMLDGGWTTVPCDVVPNAVPVGEPRSDAGAGFLFAGRLAPEKGVESALEAAAKAGVVITVAGEGPLEGILREQYPDVCFLGRVSGDEVDELIRSCRAVIVSSVCLENAPMSVLEAMAAGAPVIASDIGGIPEQVSNGAEGFLVPPHDVPALSTAMARLQADPELARRMGEAGQRTVAERFSPETRVRALLDVYAAAGVA